ncbi:MAG: M2 family metallopeptidase, partial [Acidobacteria bacterium]|nr:M2 family metallopeptidase [Acidobacteriota bacterium]
MLGPTAGDAEDFVADAEARLLSSRQQSARADWVRQNFVTADTTALAAEAAAALAVETAALAREATRFDRLDLPEATARKLARLRGAPLTIAPNHPAQQRELADLQAGLERTYRASANCAAAPGDCLDPAASRAAADLRDTDQLLDLWDEGRALTPLMRRRHERLVEIANAGAVEMGHADAGERWRSAHGLPPDTLRGELDRLWNQVRPLYESLHCLVRGGLGAEYGT